MEDKPRLIEHAFPLKQASLDSVHEKNVRHGHISTLHIWPARRPLAACRAALIATLLPDPGTPEERQKLCEKIGGKVVKKVEKKRMPNGRVVERIKEETEGGILHWKRETENAEDLAWFRQKIREAYDGRAPKVLDPFAGGGAIPLEAMRLGCEATAVDINPVAWFILKCTLEYPQKLAGRTHPLPVFILEDDDFMEAFYRAHPHLRDRTRKTKKQIENEKNKPGLFDRPDSGRVPKADLAWHVRAWGHWVLSQARQELVEYYPTYADFEPLDKKKAKPYEKQSMKLVPLKDDGTTDIDSLNERFDKKYLEDKKNPRWVSKPPVAYLWARTVTCKNCRAEIPLLKTLWLCKKDRKRVLLEMQRNNDNTGVTFSINQNVPIKGGNAAQKREHDKRIGSGTMSRSGTKCPCCGTIMTTQDMKVIGRNKAMGTIPLAVVVNGNNGKEYRRFTEHEIDVAVVSDQHIENAYSHIPYGVPDEPLPSADRHRAVGSQLPGYGLKTWRELFTNRQLLALAALLKSVRDSQNERSDCGYSKDWNEAIEKYLTLIIDKTADYGSALATWILGLEAIRGTFARFAFSWTWDFCETNPIGNSAGCFLGALEWTVMALSNILEATKQSSVCNVDCRSVLKYRNQKQADFVFTDPPYYDAIPYADLMDFFYVWMKRTSHRDNDSESENNIELSPNWDASEADGELIDDPGAYEGNRKQSKRAYEEGMAKAFNVCNNALSAHGRMVVVFAHKQPDAWEALAGSIIKAGFVVNGSWPIQTERGVRTNAITTASLASSVWLVCKKRPIEAKPGWDNKVLEEMRYNITENLREFWDAGIRGPDFVWAATGPAMEAYSKHPIVKKANSPGEVMTVGEFLNHVRRMVVDFVVGQVLAGDSQGADMAAVDRLDEPTAYYLLHRHDFGMEEAPSGTCILYAVSCGLSDRDLETTWDLLARTGGKASSNDDEENSDPDAESDSESGSGSTVKLKTWAHRKGRTMGYEAPAGKPVPLIDRIHRLMHLWKAGDVQKVDDYIDDNGLRRQELFKRLLQSFIELSPEGSSERSILESLSNHVQAKGAPKDIHYPMGLGDN
ncbi:MAG: DUF1156 domain-containing protein [bacterium]